MTPLLDARVRLHRGELDLDVHLTVERGETVVLLGPNGAGKSTLLRAIAGLEPLDEGRVVLDGVVLDDAGTETGARAHVPTEQRPIGVVFQHGLLFPHLDAVGNVAFGLRCRGRSRAAAHDEARAWLDRVGLGERADALPSALSGGEAQRVALARALVIEPTLLLLDEPLAALDASARAATRRVIRRHLATFDGARVVVTHDPVEAAVLADRVVVMEAGHVVQAGRADELRARPRSAYVADLAGVNLVRGDATGGVVALDGGFRLAVADDVTGAVLATVHPRAVALHRERPSGTARNVWPGEVESVDHEGARARVVVDGPLPIVAEVTAAAVDDLRLDDGGPVWVSVKATEIGVYPA